MLGGRGSSLSPSWDPEPVGRKEGNQRHTYFQMRPIVWVSMSSVSSSSIEISPPPAALNDSLLMAPPARRPFDWDILFLGSAPCLKITERKKKGGGMNMNSNCEYDCKLKGLSTNAHKHQQKRGSRHESLRSPRFGKGSWPGYGPWPFESLAKVRLSFDVSFTISWVSWLMSL